MKLRPEIQAFIDDYTRELEEENAVIFAGAGLSVPAGFVNWKELLSPLAKELHLDIDKETDLVSLSQYYCNHHQNKSALNKKLIIEFCQTKQVTENHKILSRLPIKVFWTTNYDDLIERSLKDVNKIVDVKYSIKHLPLTVPRRDVIVYKMHGDASNPSEAIIGFVAQS